MYLNDVYKRCLVTLSHSPEVVVHKVEKGKFLELKYRRKFPYEKIISLLMEGHEVFLQIDRQAAYRIRKYVEKRIGELIEVYPSIYDGMDGYLFKCSFVKEVMRRMIGKSDD